MTKFIKRNGTATIEHKDSLKDLFDYEKQFEKSYVEPLKFITNAIHWHIDESYGTQATLMDFFN